MTRIEKYTGAPANVYRHDYCRAKSHVPTQMGQTRIILHFSHTLFILI